MRKHLLKQNTIYVILILLLVVFAVTGCGSRAGGPADTIGDTDAFLKERGGIEKGEDITAASWYRAGDSLTDWIMIMESGAGLDADYEKYLDDLKKYVEEAYGTEKKLDRIKATEWHRIALAVMAAGGDPTSFGSDRKGDPIDLIRDGTYGWTQTDELDAQGSNALIYGIHVLRAWGGEVPEDAKYTEEIMLEKLLGYRAEDGGFCLAGRDSDMDITAMAVHALAYYRDDDRISRIIDEAIEYLSERQSQGGYYIYYDRYSSETCAQVVTSLSAAGIDPREDERFEKAGADVVEALLTFKNDDGGFASSLDTSGRPEDSDMMATYQAFGAMTSLMLMDKGNGRSIYEQHTQQDKE